MLYHIDDVISEHWLCEYIAVCKDARPEKTSSNMLKPPEETDKRRHSLGGKLAAALHL